MSDCLTLSTKGRNMWHKGDPEEDFGTSKKGDVLWTWEGHPENYRFHVHEARDYQHLNNLLLSVTDHGFTHIVSKGIFVMDIHSMKARSGMGHSLRGPMDFREVRDEFRMEARDSSNRLILAWNQFTETNASLELVGLTQPWWKVKLGKFLEKDHIQQITYLTNSVLGWRPDA